MYSLGIDLGGTNIVASVVDDQYNIISTAKTKTNAPRPANAIFDDVEKVCREAVREAKLTMGDLVAVGMGSPGTCNADGVIEFANNLAFNNVPAREMLRERLGVDNVFVENDANCAALGEAFAGCGNGSKNFVAVTLGTGVGSGIILDGKIVNGGFMVLEPGVFDYIEGDDTVFEKAPLEQLAKDGQLMVYRHDGFWKCMDTQRDKMQLEQMWQEGNAPWKLWK